jgi:hypothetical protein
MPIIPDNDPNEAYEVIPMPIQPHGPRDGWWTVICNGIPVHHFAPERRDLAERYQRDPGFRLASVRRFLHDRGDSQSKRWPT